MSTRLTIGNMLCQTCKSPTYNKKKLLGLYLVIVQGLKPTTSWSTWSWMQVFVFELLEATDKIL